MGGHESVSELGGNMFFMPRRFKCPKCGLEMDYSQSLHYKFQPTSEGKPLCSACLLKFLVKNVPVMELCDK